MPGRPTRCAILKRHASPPQSASPCRVMWCVAVRRHAEPPLHAVPRASSSAQWRLRGSCWVSPHRRVPSASATSSTSASPHTTTTASWPFAPRHSQPSRRLARRRIPPPPAASTPPATSRAAARTTPSASERLRRRRAPAAAAERRWRPPRAAAPRARRRSSSSPTCCRIARRRGVPVCRQHVVVPASCRLAFYAPARLPRAPCPSPPGLGIRGRSPTTWCWELSSAQIGQRVLRTEVLGTQVSSEASCSRCPATPASARTPAMLGGMHPFLGTSPEHPQCCQNVLCASGSGSLSASGTTSATRQAPAPNPLYDLGTHLGRQCSLERRGRSAPRS
mmetsp:Transcript_39469/g.126521  ORF Transcript_39469/g.126521 Transcript_39469/m.126521 type:complete len:335 (-) Transcript_39469:1011-2015(-)